MRCGGSAASPRRPSGTEAPRRGGFGVQKAPKSLRLSPAAPAASRRLLLRPWAVWVQKGVFWGQVKLYFIFLGTCKPRDLPIWGQKSPFNPRRGERGTSPEGIPKTPKRRIAKKPQKPQKPRKRRKIPTPQEDGKGKEISYLRVRCQPPAPQLRDSSGAGGPVVFITVCAHPAL